MGIMPPTLIEVLDAQLASGFLSRCGDRLWRVSHQQAERTAFGGGTRRSV